MLARRTFVLGGGLPLLFTGAASAQTATPNENLAVLARFLGNWQGEGSGQPGESTVERSYEVAPGGNFITVRNVSTYAPQPKNPKGEIHTDISWISFDRIAKTVVLRQFHLAETFVNTYVAAAESLKGDSLVFETLAIENIPVGFKARETYTFTGSERLEEKFEISAPGKPFETYSINRLHRVGP